MAHRKSLITGLVFFVAAVLIALTPDVSLAGGRDHGRYGGRDSYRHYDRGSRYSHGGHDRSSFSFSLGFGGLFYPSYPTYSRVYRDYDYAPSYYRSYSYYDTCDAPVYYAPPPVVYYPAPRAYYYDSTCYPAPRPYYRAEVRYYYGR